MSRSGGPAGHRFAEKSALLTQLLQGQYRPIMLRYDPRQAQDGGIRRILLYPGHNFPGEGIAVRAVVDA